MILGVDHYKDFSLGSNKHKSSDRCVAFPSTKMRHLMVEIPSQVLACTVRHGHQRSTHHREERKALRKRELLLNLLNILISWLLLFHKTITAHVIFQGPVIIVLSPYKPLTDQTKSAYAVLFCNFIETKLSQLK